MKCKHWLHRAAVVLLMLLVLCCPLSLRAEAAPLADESAAPYDNVYYYYMRVVQTGEKTDTELTGTIVLELYACTRDADAPILEGASFGFRFPSYFGQVLTFTPSENIIMQRIVPLYRSPDEILDKDTYHAFAWNRYVAALGDRPQDISQWETGDIDAPAGTAGHLLIGTYTFSGNGALPAAASIGQLDWLTATEAQGAVNEIGVELINDAIWSESEHAYIGYYAHEVENTAGEVTDVRILDTPLELVFEKPEAWKGVFNVQSYDPKKNITIELYPWDDEAKAYQPDSAYRLVISGESNGIGVSVQTIRFEQEQFQNVLSSTMVKGWELPSGRYEIEVRKAGHVGGYLSGVTVSREGGEVQVFPELDGQTLTLPCGDVTGDGRIRQADRAELTRPGRYMSAVEAGNVYDLNGDGRIDQKDLAILTSPANYGKNDFKKGFTKQEGPTETTKVGENGV